MADAAHSREAGAVPDRRFGGGRSSPFFQAQSVLNTAREAKRRKDRLSPLRELGVIMLAMQMSEKGVTAVQRAKLKAQVERELPI